MYIPKYYFSFDTFIEGTLESDDVSLSKVVLACFKEIDRIDRIPRNRLKKFEQDNLISYRSLLNGLQYYLRFGVSSDEELIEKKFKRIRDKIIKSVK